MDHDLDKYFSTCMQLVDQASEVIRNAFTKAKKVESKTCDIDLVTETDKEVEVLLIGGLKKAFPSHKFIGEESVAAGEKCVLGDEPTWVIDPVDGTMNFVHSLPLVAISVGLLIEKKPVIGIICNPILKLTYTARIGQGAYLNGERIRVSGQTDLSQSLICTECGTNRNPERRRVVLKNHATILDKCHGTRSLGSAAMNMANVANGGFDGYFEFGLHAWDMAAGDLIIREAGGVVFDTTGGPFDVLNRRVVCAGSEKLAREIAGLLEHLELERD